MSASASATHDWPLKRRPLSLETSMPGVLAAGDVRHASVKRVVSAVGEGAIAVQLVHSLFADDRTHLGSAARDDRPQPRRRAGRSHRRMAETRPGSSPGTPL